MAYAIAPKRTLRSSAFVLTPAVLAVACLTLWVLSIWFAFHHPMTGDDIEAATFVAGL